MCVSLARISREVHGIFREPGGHFGSGLRLSALPRSLGIGLGQIHNDKPVEDVGELRIDVEAHQSPAEPQIVLQQHRDAALAGIDIRHHGREIVHVQASVSFRRATERISSHHQVFRLRPKRVAFKKRNDQME
jgi:hypothetical protein